MKNFHKLSIFVTLILVWGLLAISPAQTQVATAQVANVVYNLYATDGYVTLADGTITYIFGFIGGRKGQPLNYLDQAGVLQTLPGGAPDPTGGPVTAAELPLSGKAQFPAPIIYASVGDVVEIRLKNLGVSANPLAPNDPHSIHLHGLDVDAANDGVPETSVGAVPANMKAFAGAGNVIVYMFAPDKPGTYMYHCHQEASIHVAMGMYGALVVYNPGEQGGVTGPGTGPGNEYGYAYDKDYILLLSDMDLNQNNSEAAGGGIFNNVFYQPQYWFINGLSFPNTIHAGLGFNWNNWIAAHPGYDPFIVGSINTVHTDGVTSNGDKILLRVINMGFQAHPMHMHGFHGKIIGSDARGWDFTEGEMEKNTLLIGSGETYEWLIDMGEQKLASAQYAPNATMGTTGQPLVSTWVDPITNLMGTQTRYLISGKGNSKTNTPYSSTATQYNAIPDPFVPGAAYAGGPVVGPDSQASQGPAGLPAELPYTNGQFFPFHNHNDYQATNNGLYPGGMFTMILTTP